MTRTVPLLAIGLACGPDRGAGDSAPPAPATAVPAEVAHAHPHAAATMHHRFENAEEWSRKFDAKDRDEWQKPAAVIAKLKLKRTALVADIGAGTGYFTVRLAKVVSRGKVFAVDVEPDMVRHIEERANEQGLDNVVTVLGREDNPSLAEHVDVAFLCDVVHHIEDRPAFFAKIADRLRPGGRIVIVDFSPDAPDGGPGPPKQHRVSPATLDVELGAADLERTAFDDTLLRYQYIVEYRANRRR
jgi:SAM-dependent methyltransferase